MIGRPVFREAVVHHVVALDAERVLDELGGAVTIVAVDRLLEEVWSWGYASLIRGYCYHFCYRTA
jgi:hypothetical protein